MADVRITGISVPDAPERYDRRNEADFRRVVLGLKDEIDNVLQRLKTAARDGVVFTTTDQTIAGDKTFTGLVRLDSNNFLHIRNASASVGLRLERTGSAAASMDIKVASTGMFFGTSGEPTADAHLILGASSPYFQFPANFTLSWSDTNDKVQGVTFDTNLYRGAANQLKTDDDLVVGGDILPQGNIDLNVAGRIYARGSTFAPGNGNEFDGVLALGAGARVYLAALQYSADNDINSLRIYTHPSGTGADPSVLTAEFRGDPPSGYTALFIQHRAGGTLQFEQVALGATDSGGTGFRVLRIPN